MNIDIDSFTAIEGFMIASKTKDAYMADDYGSEEWFNCVCFLLMEGFKAEAVENIVRSKHMRWCSDGRGIQTGDEFIRYYNKYKIGITDTYPRGL